MDNKVFFAACKSYDSGGVTAQIDRILDWAGGAESFLAKGGRVLIKPNLLMARRPESATTAHPEVVAAVVRAFVKAGADVTIADSPGGQYNKAALDKVYSACGMDEAARRSGARLNYDFSGRSVDYFGRSLHIMTPALDSDVIICVAKMKTHMLTYYTGAVKNMFGTVTGTHKAALHAKHPYAEDFSKMLVDLCAGNTPVFSIVDGIVGMEGQGPSGGRPREGGLIIASHNPWAADLAAMDFCGLEPGKAPVHRLGAKRGLVPSAPAGLEMHGDRVERQGPPFEEAGGRGSILNNMHAMAGLLRFDKIKRRFMAYPQITSRCVGCGDCAAVCPQKTIRIEDRKAVINRDNCIKCYCCHELCPIKAIDV